MIEGLKSGMTLYHGSYCEVEHPDLQKCKKYKDFGQGFYLTSDFEQARQFALLSLRKSIENGETDASQTFGVVSSFSYSASSSDKTCFFENADSDWLHCVVAYRKRNSFNEIVNKMEMYDIIGGKIANDATNATILAYMAGTFGLIGSEQADRICISLLQPERLKNQYCFKTPQAIEHLTFQKSEKIWM